MADHPVFFFFFFFLPPSPSSLGRVALICRRMKRKGRGRWGQVNAGAIQLAMTRVGIGTETVSRIYV